MSYTAGTSTVTLSGVTVGDTFCGVYQVCLGCGVSTNGPAEEPVADLCGHAWVYTGDPCDEFDPDCIPVWYVEAIIDRWETVCSGLPSGGIPFDWPFEIPDYITVPGPPNMLMCHMLQCLNDLTGKLRTDCFTIEDFQDTPPAGVDESEWQGCYSAFLLLQQWWQSYGELAIAEHCIGLDLGDLYPTGRILRKATLHFIGTATEPVCDELGECECP